MATKPLQASSIDNPQETFESALALMRQSGGPSDRRAASTGVARTRPIVPVGSEQSEKRALTDAARALARLWNVSPHLVR